jgi:hypothetical protein
MSQQCSAMRSQQHLAVPSALKSSWHSSRGATAEALHWATCVPWLPSSAPCHWYEQQCDAPLVAAAALVLPVSGHAAAPAAADSRLPTPCTPAAPTGARAPLSALVGVKSGPSANRGAAAIPAGPLMGPADGAATGPSTAAMAPGLGYPCIPRWQGRLG